MSDPSRPNAKSRQGLIDERASNRLIRLMLLLAVVVLAGAVIWVSHQALRAFDQVLLPEFDRDASLVGQAIVIDFERALALDIPLPELRGVDDYFEDYRHRHTGLRDLVLFDRELVMIYGTGPDLSEIVAAVRRAGPEDLTAAPMESLTSVRGVTLPIRAGNRPEAYLYVGMDRGYAQQQIADIRWDIVIVLIVSLLVTFELLVFLVDRTLLSPLRVVEGIVARALDGEWTVRPRGQRVRGDEIGHILGALDRVGREISETYRRIDRKLLQLRQVPDLMAVQLESMRREIRLTFDDDPRARYDATNARFPLFVFVFAEELSRSFLPLYAEQLYVPLADLGLPFTVPFELSPQVVIGLPIMVFMAGIAIATPFGGAWVERYGSRTIFLAGGIPATLGYLGTAFAVTAYDLLLWRSLSAIGYALITIACQGYLAQIATEGQRARNMAIFVAAVTTAVICGSAIGAVLADRLGFRVTFLVSASLVMIAVWLAATHMHTADSAFQAARLRWQDLKIALRNPHFVALVVFAAIPAKIALTGFLFYLTPIFLASLNVGQPAIGRTIMLYGLLMLVGTRLGARYSEAAGGFVTIISLGGVLTGVAAVVAMVLEPATAMPLAVAIFGLGQGLAAAPMLAILPRICPDVVATIGQTGLSGLLRVGERIGSVIGPLIAALLIASVGYLQAIFWIGGISASSALLYYMVNALPGWAPKTGGDTKG